MILDTSVLIDAERTHRTVEQVLSSFPRRTVFVSSVTLMELAEGITRAKDEPTRDRRRKFLNAVRRSIGAIPVNAEIAVDAGLLHGRLRSEGITVGFADAMIAATALRQGDGVATLNRSHFAVVPGLDVVEL